MMSLADGTDSSSVFQPDPSPAVGPMAEFVNTTLSIVGRLGLGSQPSARLSPAASVLSNRRRATTQSAEVGQP
jgi:hypothetical protein